MEKSVWDKVNRRTHKGGNNNIRVEINKEYNSKVNGLINFFK